MAAEESLDGRVEYLARKRHFRPNGLVDANGGVFVHGILLVDVGHHVGNNPTQPGNEQCGVGQLRHQFFSCNHKVSSHKFNRLSRIIL